MNFLAAYKNKEGVIEKARVRDCDDHLQAIQLVKDTCKVKTVLVLIEKTTPVINSKEDAA